MLDAIKRTKYHNCWDSQNNDSHELRQSRNHCRKYWPVICNDIQFMSAKDFPACETHHT